MGGENDKLGRAGVARLGALCNLELNEAEAEAMASELETILAYVAQLQEVNVDGVEPLSHALSDAPPPRADEPQPSLDRAAFLDSAPGATDEGFAVPTFLGEG
jgi:aspartyl-tRNA(Asn)/glutamyl-tRNA(Gln) amidotransferase subunit C